MPEFARPVLEALRQPIETGEVVVSRANAHVRYPASFLLAAAMNPCRCGYLTDPSRACSRAPRCGADYVARLSGPLVDRFDIRIEVPPVTPAMLSLPPHGESSARIAARVAGARGVQSERMNGSRLTNGELEGEMLDRVATPDAPGQQVLSAAAEKLKLTARLSPGAPAGADPGRSRRVGRGQEGACGRGGGVPAGAGVRAAPRYRRRYRKGPDIDSMYLRRYISARVAA